MAVLRLVSLGNDDTVQTLEWMLQEARRHRLADFLSSFRDDAGVPHYAFTGLYRADSSKALWEIMRMKEIVLHGGQVVRA